MRDFPVLEDYIIHIVMSSPEGHAGEIRHVFRAENGMGVQTPVGFFMAFIGELSEIRPAHWEIQLFLRSDVEYDIDQKKCRIVPAGGTHRYGCHPELPKNLGNALIQHGFCEEPIALSVSDYRNSAFVEFGNTWADDD